MVYNLLDMASLAIFTLGAVVFSVLTVFYWGERRRRKTPRKPTVFPVFTLVCAAAFLDSLLLQILFLHGAGSPLGVAVILVRDLTTGLLPPLMLHLVFETELLWLPGRRWWRGILFASYGGGVAFPLMKGLNETGVASVPWSDLLYAAPAAMLAAASSWGLLLQAFSRRRLAAGECAHRNWIRAVLILMVVCAAASLGGCAVFVGQIPDYLVLVFFSVSLYYRERLVFFDLLVKRGAFLALGLVMLAVSFAIRPPTEWSPWIYGLGLVVFWLMGSWVYPYVARAIDHAWLRRPYTAADAERQFILEIQVAASEEELLSRAAGSLRAIFQAPAEVRFDATPISDREGSLTVELERNHARIGSILLAPRPNGIPFLSEDRRLLQPLAGTLCVVLENVRFRVDRSRQEEREQRLRWLATRAELKALRAQINPHFLFNALSVIAGLVRYQPELADETIEQLAQVFRYTLRKSDNEWSPLAEEVEFVAAYLRVEQARFGERLQVGLAVDPRAARIPIPAMCIQPLIENAIKHGVSAMAGRGAVGLRAVIDGEVLVVEVSDSGPGFPPNFALDGPGEGFGLRNVAERLRGYYGDSARLSWDSGPNGTRVVLTLPQSAVRATAGGNAS